MQINGFNKLTLLDFPKHLAATIFVGGCNMRCPFCHNASLVTDPSSQPIIPVKEVLDLLAKRKGILEGVCITGGEPTLYSDLPDLIRQIKSLGLAVKIDTNGTNPRMIKSLVDQHLIDYVAMDIKNSKENYELTSGIARIDLAVISESVSYLLADTVDYEFRTTVVKEYHTAKDILSIGNWIKGAKAYYLQSYQDSGDIISTDELHALPKET
ncbi:MAG: anaerobic ribonucleoside-triphosphate reductase activating protein, partial [Mobilitalea sp.]